MEHRQEDVRASAKLGELSQGRALRAGTGGLFHHFLIPPVLLFARKINPQIYNSTEVWLRLGSRERSPNVREAKARKYRSWSESLLATETQRPREAPALGTFVPKYLCFLETRKVKASSKPDFLLVFPRSSARRIINGNFFFKGKQQNSAPGLWAHFTPRVTPFPTLVT